MDESSSGRVFFRPARLFRRARPSARCAGHWAAILLLLGLGAALFFLLWQSYQRDIDRQRAAAQNLVRTCSLSIRLSLERVDAALRQAGEAVLAGRRSPGELHELLARLQQQSWGVRTFALVDPSGSVLALSLPGKAPLCMEFDLAALLAGHRQRPIPSLRIGKPIHCAADGQWLIPVSRAFAAAGEELGLVAVGLIPASSLSALVDTAVAGLDQNGYLILR